MKRTTGVMSSVAMALLVLRPGYAYELATHGALTFHAYTASALNTDPQLVKDLGIDVYIVDKDTVNKPLGNIYYDVLGNSVYERQTNIFEQKYMSAQDVDDLKLQGWLMRGAIREDDVPSSSGPNPQDDPYNPAGLYRVLNHFFDPAFNRPLTATGVSILYGGNVLTAPAWAVGTTDAFTQLNTPDANRRNHFTLFDARESMYRALTLKKSDGNDVFPQGQVTKPEEMRKAYWATTFRALGDVLHLNQDMAQPQHTRNDLHAGKAYDGNPGLTGHKSFYESYVEARAAGDKFDMLNGTPEVKSKPLNYGDGTYPIPTFAKYSDFWSTAPGSTNGNGLADYSNRGFFSAGTNLGENSYASPSNDVGSFGTEILPVGTALNLSGNALTGALTFKTATVPDTLNPGKNAPNQRLTTYGAWDQFLLDNNKAPAYTLNYYNYDAMADLLIPRAVAYSAGLINYFFRGKMEISLPNEGVYGILDHYDPASNAKDTGGFTKIKLKIKNTTPKGAEIEPMTTGGKLLAVVKFHRNNCYASDLSGEYGSPGKDWHTCRGEDEEIVASSTAVDAPITINSEPTQVEFSFAKPKQIPINATDLFLQVVYRGPLGDEQDAVVVATKDISEPTYVYNYIRWDQYTYKYSYPDLESPTVPGTGISWATWCLGGYPSVEACNQIMGVTVKMQYSPSADPIPGYDPAGAELWYNMDEVPEPPLSPIATLVAPVGTLARIAVLLDAVPSNTALRVSEQNDLTYQTGVFSWITGTAQAAANQRDPQTGTLTPSVRYLSGRDVYLPDIEDGYLNDGDAYPMPPLVLTPSQISPNW
jgi:hypothetical protein